jgi:hypothetical protein
MSEFDETLASVLPSKRSPKRQIKRPARRPPVDLDSLTVDIVDTPAPSPSTLPSSISRTLSRLTQYLTDSLTAFSREFISELSPLLVATDPLELLLPPFIESLRQSVRGCLDLASLRRPLPEIGFDFLDETETGVLMMVKRSDLQNYGERAGSVRIGRASLQSLGTALGLEREAAQRELEEEFAELNRIRVEADKGLK